MILLIFWFLIALILLPGTVDLILVTLGSLLPEKKNHKSGDIIHGVVVIPAHNEEKTIGSCIKSLHNMEGDIHIVVVADNCDDNTAMIARSMGAEVLERFSEDARGKPHALNFAFHQLLQRNFEWFIVVDADTSVNSNFLKEICLSLQCGNREVIQGRYSIRNARESRRTRLMNVAFHSQYLRMRGKSRLGLSTGIQGNGFVLHRQVIERVPMKAKYITEDLAYHLELVMSGYTVNYCESAEVFSDMPLSKEGIKSQRSRWEGGRFRVVRDYFPKLLKKLIRGNLYCLEPLLDLLLLPLGYHMVGVIILILLTGFSPLSLIYLMVPIVHVLLSIYLGGGTMKDFLVLATAPYYIFWKLVNLGSTIHFSRKNTTWIRTDRENE